MLQLRNISYTDMATCAINVGRSVLDHNGIDGLNGFSGFIRHPIVVGGWLNT